MTPLYLDLVNKVFNRLNLFEKGEKSKDRELTFNPFITVARDPGSGGKPIADLVANKLGFEFYDDRLIEEVAKSAKLRKEVLQQVDEKKRSQMQDLIHTLLNPDYVAESTLITHLCKVVLSLAQQGSIVMLGRGTNFIIPEAYGLRVRITAPYRVCVARAVEFEGVNYQEAREIIREVTADRTGFVKQYFGKDINNPKYYDLTINTTYMSLKDSRDLIIKAFYQKFPEMKTSR